MTTPFTLAANGEKMDEATCVFKQDFRNFLWLVWTKALGLPAPAPAQYSIAYSLQYDYLPDDDDITRAQILSLRGAGKTYILCAYALWCLYRNPNVKILYISGTDPRAKEAVILMRKIIDVLEILEPLRPRFGSRDGADRFDVGNQTNPGKDPSLASYSISSTLTGTHPDIIIADDCETPENSMTSTKRERLLENFREFEDMVQPGGWIIHMGTYQSVLSVYKELADSYNCRRWPDRFPNPTNEIECRWISEWCLEQVREDSSLIGKPIYPERFGEAQLNQKRAKQGAYRYALQYRLLTEEAEGNKHPLKLGDLIVMDCDIEQAPTNVVWGTTAPITDIKSEGMGSDRLYGPAHLSETYAKYTQSVMYVDPSGGGDKVGYAVTKSLNGIIYCLECGGLDGGHSETTLQKLARIAKHYQIRTVVVESNFGDGLYARVLGPVMAKINGATEIIHDRVKSQKEVRIIEKLRPVMAVHRLVVDRKVARHAILMSQIAQITHDRGCLPTDDEIDALAGAVGYLSAALDMDPTVQEEKAKVREKEEAHRDFIRGFRHMEARMLAGGDLLRPDSNPALTERIAARRKKALKGGKWGPAGSKRRGWK